MIEQTRGSSIKTEYKKEKEKEKIKELNFFFQKKKRKEKKWKEKKRKGKKKKKSKKRKSRLGDFLLEGLPHIRSVGELVENVGDGTDELENCL
jgi:hypothetical protein